MYVILHRVNKLILKKTGVLLKSGTSFQHKKTKTVLQFIKASQRVTQSWSQNGYKISTHLLIMEVDFCPVLCIPEVPVLQAFRGISHFVWYCKAVSDLS